MSFNATAAGLLVMALGMGGHGTEEILDTLGKCGEADAQAHVEWGLLPADGTEFYKGLGFTIGERHGDMVEVDMPAGWMLARENGGHNGLIDPNGGYKRAHIYINTNPWERSVYCRSDCRFDVRAMAACDSITAYGGGGEFYNYNVNRVGRVRDRKIVWGHEKWCRIEWESECRKPESLVPEVLADQRFLFMHGEKNNKEVIALMWASDLLDKQNKQAAEDWLNANYPDWKNPLAYWG